MAKDKFKWKAEDIVFEEKPAKVKKTTARFRIVKVDAKQRIIGGVIYEPLTVDSQGDYTDRQEIEKGMYGFMEKYFDDPKRIKVMHAGKWFSFPILECFQPDEDTKKGGEVIKAGSWWMMLKITDPGIWTLVETGKITGFSMGGEATA